MLVHRSQQDARIADNDAPQYVLMPVNEKAREVEMESKVGMVVVVRRESCNSLISD